MRPMVGSVLEGYNATVLAYGQTGSGKTHTMGTAEAAADVGAAAGLIPRALNELFSRAHAADSGLSCAASCTFIEIYKEEVHDLLNFSAETGTVATLPIRENGDGNGGLTLTGQQSKAVSSVEEAMAVLAEGARNRATGSTAMNATSSRSHAIFTLALDLKLADGKTFTPKLHFVDLAGSERAKRTGATGERLQEGIQINKGLLALGNVINALCEKHNHVPYRDSKLTRLLQDSLGGNSKTMMLACVSPGDADLEETLNTLKYANRARQIRNKPIVAQDPMQARLSELMETINALQARLTHYEGGGAPLPPLAAAAAPLNNGAAGAAAGSAGAAAGAAAAGGGATGGGGTSAPDAVLLRRVTQLTKENEGLKHRIATLLRAGGGSSSAAKGEWSTGEIGMVSASSEGALMVTLPEDDAMLESGEPSSRKTSSGSSSSRDSDDLNPSAAEDDPALAQEAMEEELAYMEKQSELSEQYESLSQSLQIKQALLAQQPDLDGEGGSSSEDLNTLCEALQALETKLKDVESERDSFSRQVNELRMHSDESGQPSKAAEKKLEQLAQQVEKLKRQRAQQEALLKARQASDLRVKQLEGEISHIKAQKAAIARRQKEEADNHKSQRIARERELMQLRRKGERTAMQLSKLEDEHAKQAQVLKRKHEEVQAMQKRAKQQEQNQASAQASRAAAGKPAVGAGGAGGGIPTPRNSVSSASSAFGSSVKGGTFGGGGLPSARKPAAGGGGGIAAPTESQRAKLEGKKAEDRQAEVTKAAAAIAVNPKEWLKKELTEALNHQQLSQQVELQIEMRKQAARQLQALEVRAEGQAAEEAMDVSDGGEDAAAVAAARAAEAEALKVKVAHHTSLVRDLQSKLMQLARGSTESAHEALCSKIDALGRMDHAKALLKQAVPSLVALKIKLEDKEEKLVAARKATEDATTYASNMALTLARSRKENQEQGRASEQALLEKAMEITELRAQLNEQSRRAATLAIEEKKEAREADNERAKNMAMLDAKLIKIKTGLAKNAGGGAAAAPAASSASSAAAGGKTGSGKKKAEEEEDTPSEESEEEEEEDDESGMESDDSDASWIETDDAKGRRSLGSEALNKKGGKDGGKAEDVQITCDVCQSDCSKESYFCKDAGEDVCPECYTKEPAKYPDAEHQRGGEPVAPPAAAPKKRTSAAKGASAAKKAAKAAPVSGAFDDLMSGDDVLSGDDAEEDEDGKRAVPKRAAAAVSEAKLVAAVAKSKKGKGKYIFDLAEEGMADEPGVAATTAAPAAAVTVAAPGARTEATASADAEAKPAKRPSQATAALFARMEAAKEHARAAVATSASKAAPKAPAPPKPPSGPKPSRPAGAPARAPSSELRDGLNAATSAARAALGKLPEPNTYHSSDEGVLAAPAVGEKGGVAKVEVSLTKKKLYNPRANHANMSASAAAEASEAAGAEAMSID